MTAATALGESPFDTGAVKPESTLGPATSAAAGEATTGLLNALADPTVMLLPSRSPLAALTTTVPD